MADRREQRATCPTCGHSSENRYCETCGGPCMDDYHSESSSGAAPGPTPQDRTQVIEYWLGVAEDNGRLWTGMTRDDLKDYFGKLYDAGVAATVETPPSLDVDKLNTLLGRLKRAVAEREPKQHYACALWTEGADSDGCGGCFSCMEADLNEITELMEEADREVAGETPQPASEPQKEEGK